MDTATHPVTSFTPDAIRAVPAAQTLTVAAVYHLTEVGRKASLLAGGDGKGVQRLAVQVPATRLHLVSVDLQGNARLKLQPRFDRVDDGVIRREGPPAYDTPPTLDDLFREAAKNHELERAFQSERSQSRDRRREADRDRRSTLAHEFLSDATQRALPHPAPTPKRCYLATANGRVMFDAGSDVGPARDLPKEAYRRFRADLRARKEQNLKTRADGLALHEEKLRVVAEWVAAHGTDDQRGRHAAGLLPLSEVIAALTNEAFACVNDVTPYPLDGADRLQAHLRALTGRTDLTVAPTELRIVGLDATAATAAQWAMVRHLQSRLPDADVTLREHRLTWRREPALPALSVYGVLATRQVGPFILRREFAVSER